MLEQYFKNLENKTKNLGMNTHFPKNNILSVIRVKETAFEIQKRDTMILTLNMMYFIQN